MNKIEIAQLINETYQGVEASMLGPITKIADDGTIILNTLPMHAFLAIVAKIFPTVVSGDMKHWEG